VSVFTGVLQPVFVDHAFVVAYGWLCGNANAGFPRKKTGVTGKLKADNQMEWVALMNSVRSRATEKVNTDWIYG